MRREAVLICSVRRRGAVSVSRWRGDPLVIGAAAARALAGDQPREQQGNGRGLWLAGRPQAVQL